MENSTNKIKVGILGHGFIEWGGGIDFIRIISESLVAVDDNIEIHFLFPIAGPNYQTRLQLRRVKKIIYNIIGKSYNLNMTPQSHHLEELVTSISRNTYLHKIDTGMRAIQKISSLNKIDILLPSINPLKNQKIPWIGYLYDYQHAYYPEFFSKEEIASRNIQFKRMLSEASHVIVNAKSVLDDIKKYNPEHQAKIICLPFSAAPKIKWLKLPLIKLDKYRIKDEYFIISNQFWQHKDHITAWHAFALVLKKYPNVQLVCTGETYDYRNPKHFKNLMELADQLKIAHKILILGLINKDEQVGLIRSAIAMIQPSLFEGGPGGGAVYDAVSLGVPCIVSDIKVNRELKEPIVTFFKAGDQKSLAQVMLKKLYNKEIKTATEAEDLIALGVMRRKECGEKLIEIVKNIIK
jgi:glycosyltransferase involved in cell wall biosynthesis